MQNEINPSARRVMNRNIGVTNCMNKDAAHNHLFTALEGITELLSRHCGPDASYAIIMAKQSGTGKERPVFTKDGINILHHLEYMAPVEEFIKKQICYIGENVEKYAGDGTTTSMLFASKFLDTLIRKINASETSYTTSNIAAAYRFIVEQLMENVSRYTWTVDAVLAESKQEKASISQELTRAQAIQRIAYVQAMSSSGGNKELSSVVAELFSRVPEQMWDYITPLEAAYETKKSFFLEPIDAQYYVRSTCITPRKLNHNLNFEYKNEGVKLLVCTDVLADEGPMLDAIRNYIFSHMEDRIAIIAPGYGARIMRSLATGMFQGPAPDYTVTTHPNVVAFAHVNHVLSDNALELGVLCAIAGKIPVTNMIQEQISEFHVLEGTELHWVNSELHVKNVVDMPEGTSLHPWYTEPEKACETPFGKYYMTLLGKIEEEVTYQMNAFDTNPIMLDALNLAYSKMIYINQVRFYIGGMTYQHLTAIDVARDALRATRFTLKHGFVFGAMWSLLRCVLDIQPESKEQSDIPYSYSLEEIIKITLKEACIYTLEQSYGESITMIQPKGYVGEVQLLGAGLTDIDATHSSSMEICVSGKQCYIHLNDTCNKGTMVVRNTDVDIIPENRFRLVDFTMDHNGAFLDNGSDILETMHPSYLPVTHPVTMYEQMLTRIDDLLIKFVSLSDVIVPGSVFLSTGETVPTTENTDK